jgi:hypothetical protein
MKALVPERAMVPRLLMRSALVMPMPLSIRVTVLLALSGMMWMNSSFWLSRRLLSVRDWYLILSRASLALEISSAARGGAGAGARGQPDGRGGAAPAGPARGCRCAGRRRWPAGQAAGQRAARAARCSRRAGGPGGIENIRRANLVTSQEDLLVAVERVDDQAQQLVDLGLEREGLDLLLRHPCLGSLVCRCEWWAG